MDIDQPPFIMRHEPIAQDAHEPRQHDQIGRIRIDGLGHRRIALLGIRRFSPRVVFLGSYPRADRKIVHYPERYSDDVFIEARDWLRGLISGAPDA